MLEKVYLDDRAILDNDVCRLEDALRFTAEFDSCFGFAINQYTEKCEIACFWFPRLVRISYGQSTCRRSTAPLLGNSH